MPMIRGKKAKLDVNLKQKAIADIINKLLKPVEKIFIFGKASFTQSKDAFPALYRYFENIVRHHIVTPSKDLFKSSRIGDMGSFITANVMKRIPHVDEAQVEEMLHNPSNKSFRYFDKRIWNKQDKGKKLYHS